MLKKSGLFLFSVCFLFVTGCNNGSEGKDGGDADKYTRKITDTPNVAAIMMGYDAKDTTVIGAYLDDQTTISTEDIDPNDKTYTARTKVLYHAGPDGKKLAVVYGLKAEGKGMAVVQKVGEKPIFLKEESKKDGVTTYSDGKFKIEQSGDFVFIDGVQYLEIK